MFKKLFIIKLHYFNLFSGRFPFASLGEWSERMRSCAAAVSVTDGQLLHAAAVHITYTTPFPAGESQHVD